MPDLQIKGYSATFQYKSVPKVYIDTPESTEDNPVLAPYTFGEAVSKNVQPDFSAGDMQVPIADGELVTELTVIKPEELVPENIPEGQYIAGVGPGTFQGGGGSGDAGFSTKAIAERTISGVIAASDVTFIASYAFWGCSQITKAAFPLCSTLGSAAFSGCTSLSSIELDYANISWLESNVFTRTIISGALSFPICTKIGAKAFQECSLVSEVSVSSGAISMIYEGAFEGCKQLLTVHGLSTTISVSSNAFSRCNKLTLPSGTTVRYVSDFGFFGCSEVSEIKFPSYVTTIGNEAFADCTKLQIQDNTLTMGPSRIWLKPAVFLGFAAFSNCVALSRLSFTVTAGTFSFGVWFGGFQFAGCTALSLFVLGPKTIAFSVDSYWFYKTPITDSSYLGDFGSIYMPASKYESFMALSGWSYYQSRIVSYTSVGEIPE